MLLNVATQDVARLPQSTGIDFLKSLSLAIETFLRDEKTVLITTGVTSYERGLSNSLHKAMFEITQSRTNRLASVRPTLLGEDLDVGTVFDPNNMGDNTDSVGDDSSSDSESDLSF